MFKSVSGFCLLGPSPQDMERHHNSATRTPLNNVGVQRRSKSYRLSYRSCLGTAASRLGLTPALTARRLNTSRRALKPHGVAEKVDPEQLALLVKTEWQLSYVTPLHQFRHTQLKSYSRRLAAFIAAGKQQGLAVAVENPQTTFRVSFSLVEGMTESADDAETVLIQIHARPSFAGQDEPQRPAWSGWLTCVNGNPDYLRSLPKDFTCLPLFGSSGAEGLGALVKSWFQQSFDCCFGPLEVSHTSLQWLMALWTNCHTEASIQHLKMIWTLPAVPPLEVTYTVNPEDAWELWRSVRKQKENRGGGGEEEENCIDIEEVADFVQGLKSHFYRHFRLDLSAGSLNQVSTALGSAKHSGRMKISNSRYMTTTLTLLTESALLKMPI
ncbi:centromere protein L isoform X1 [Cyclopterus lumpus]|uniref:centromere protein L isoform X1 n=1 Tax=Cyclopterus lumpus TaxID=8103 RepID=UPI00148649EA|nr:centromere protein L isoform X1 [Cyclopterus lumpus]